MVFFLDPHLLFGFQGLVQAVAVTAARHQPAGELVDDDDLAVLDHVIDVALEEVMGLEGLVDVVDEIHIRQVVEVGDVQAPFGFRDPVVEDRDRTGLLVDLEVLVLVESPDEVVHLVVAVRRLLGRAGDDQGRPRLVDQDAVDFVDDGVVMAPLDKVGQAELHVVAQVVEPELVVRSVGDVGVIGRLPVDIVHLVLDRPHVEPEGAEDRPHPLRVALGQVIVDRDDMDAFAFEGVEVGGERGDERFSLARLHFGYLALVEDHAADDLDIERAHPDGAAGGLAGDGERFDQDVIQGGALAELVLEFGGLGAKLVVRQLLDAGFDLVRGGHVRLELFQVPFVLGPEDLRNQPL